MVTLDAAQMTTPAEAHTYLAGQLNFPEYYGRNLDALYDCLTELADTEVRFINTSDAAGTYFDKVLRVFREAAEDNERLHIAE